MGKKSKTPTARNPYFAADITAARLGYVNSVRTLVSRLADDKDIADDDFCLAMRAVVDIAPSQIDIAKFIPTETSNLARWMSAGPAAARPAAYARPILLKRLVEYIDSKVIGIGEDVPGPR